MSTVFNRTLMGATAFAAALAFVPATQAATVIQGTVGERIGTSFGGSFTDVRYVSGETAEFKMPATLLCVDMKGIFPDDGLPHTYAVSSTGLASIKDSAANSRATDMFHYAVDQFYDSMVLREVARSNTGFQFTGLLWELEQDFNGLASSLDALSGGMQASMLKLADGAPAYTDMVKALRDNYDNIVTGYRSKRYTIDFLDDQAEGAQSMMMLTPYVVSEVPEPGTLALGLLAGAALLRRKPRPLASTSGSQAA